MRRELSGVLVAAVGVVVLLLLLKGGRQQGHVEHSVAPGMLDAHKHGAPAVADRPPPAAGLAKPVVKALSGDQREQVLKAVEHIHYLRKRGVGKAAVAADQQVLAQYGNAALATAADDLAQGNSREDDDRDLTRRLAEIDLLGFAAASNSTARAMLSRFATSSIDPNKPTRLIHMDLADRMEAFSLWAKVDADAASAFIKTVGNRQLRREYIYQLVTGLHLAGLNEEDAVEKAYQMFGQDDLGPSLTQQAKDSTYE